MGDRISELFCLCPSNVWGMICTAILTFGGRVLAVSRALAAFTPLVLSSTGGMGKAATVFYKRLTSMLSEKRDVPYSKTIGWLHCRLSFALLCCSIMCIRGSRSSHHHPAMESMDLQLAEGQILLTILLTILHKIHYEYIIADV